MKGINGIHMFSFSSLRIIALIGIVCYSLSANAQDYTADMTKIQKAYAEGSMSFHVQYLFYPYDSLKKVTDSMTANCNLSNGEYYYKISTDGKKYEYVKNSKYFFVIDHNEKAIAVKKSSDNQQQVWDVSKLDSLAHSKSVKISYKDAGIDEGEYIISLNEGVWTSIKLVFNKKHYTLDKMYLSSNKKGSMMGQEYSHPKIVINYTGYSNTQADKNLFDESKFFTENSGIVNLTNDYKKYKLLNYLQKKS